MIVTESGIVIDVIPESMNAFESIFVTLSGNSIVLRAEQLRNISDGIYSRAAGSLTDLRDVSLWNNDAGRVLNLSSILTFSRFEFAKANSFNVSTVEGMFNSFMPLSVKA